MAAAVVSGSADTGLAVVSAVQALELDFIPVAQERDGLAIPQEFSDTAKLRALLGIIRDDKEFREQIIAMGGYDVSEMGRVIGVY